MDTDDYTGQDDISVSTQRRLDLLRALEGVQRAVARETPCCAKCKFYWEDSEVEFRPWGHCRFNPPVHIHEQGEDRLACPTVSFDWYCGRYLAGNHPDVKHQRELWKLEYGL